ncbi:hypothetical protein [Collinsella tanakaei]|uniref:hypothetical protein n=1 Tax=Collinsella tanakaei TaxID=626935 RepID=UPI001956D744|nr:hypothetical protein [Collinsella tanakaei]MBM6868911.1 hypothetical protein [Collinsella tanakaei]
MYDETTTEYDGIKLAESIGNELELVADELQTWMLEDDYSEYRSNIKPGETLEEKGFKLKTDLYKGKLRERCEEAARRINELCDRAERRARAEMSEPPSPEALAYCQALAARKSVTVPEVESALERYGSNWSCYQLLKDVIDTQRKSGNRDFYRLNPRNTLDGWEKQIKSIRNEGTTFARQYLARQAWRYEDELPMRLEQVKLYMGYAASNGGDRFGARPDAPGASSWQAHVSASRGFC